MTRKIIRSIKYVSNAISNIKQGKSTVEEKVILTFVIFILTLLLVLVATIRFWIVPALGIAFFGYLIYEHRPKSPPTPVFNLMESAYRELFWVLSEIHDRIDAVRPIDLHDIAMMPPVVTRSNGIEVIKAKVSKASRVDFEEEKLKTVRKIIQTRIDDHLRSGRVENIPFASLDSQTPIFWIDRVYDDAATLFLDIVVVDTNENLRYVINSQFAEAAPPPFEPSDEDFS